MTLRALECLSEADLVIHDRLVPERILEYAPASAERVCVSRLEDYHGAHGERIQRMMIDAAKQGKRVIRLKGGDPFIFGRGGEEAEALRQAGISYEVVPGVTAALGAAASAGIPLTHRDHASAVAFVTGHENPAKAESALDWPALARFPGTLVVYMGIAHLPNIVQSLLAHGKSADTPAAAVRWATTGAQQTVEAPLGELAKAVQTADLAAPAVLVIGSVVSLRAHIAWFEGRPLFGKRVLVTRPGHQAGGLVQRLERLGAVPLVLPAVEIRAPNDWSAVDRALANLERYHWLVFTSANGVAALIGRLRATGRDVRALGNLKLAAIGPATADALRSCFLEPDLVPPEYRSESLAAELKEKAAGQRILLARADRGRDVLREELAGVAAVDPIAVYSQVDSGAGRPEVLEALRQGEVDYITVTSSNIARSLASLLDASCWAPIEAGRTQCVSISPVTSAAMRALGLPVAAEAAEYTTAGIVAALVGLAREENQARTPSGRG